MEKQSYAEYVLLTEAEYQKLVDMFDEFWALRMIDKLNWYKGSSGRQYDSDYCAIRSWVVGAIINSKEYVLYRERKFREEKQRKFEQSMEAAETIQRRIPGIDQIGRN